MSNKQPITINIVGDSDEHTPLLAIILADFLEFTGFTVKTNMSRDISDDELTNMLTQFEDNLQNCINAVDITISE